MKIKFTFTRNNSFKSEHLTKRYRFLNVFCVFTKTIKVNFDILYKMTENFINRNRLMSIILNLFLLLILNSCYYRQGRPSPSETMMHFPSVSDSPLVSKNCMTLWKNFKMLPFPDKFSDDFHPPNF